MISRDEVRQIARLARLDLSPEEEERMEGDLSRILEYIAQLSSVATDAVDPLNGGTDMVHQTRSDERTEEYREALCNPETAAALVNAAPAHKNGYVKVKSVF